MNEYRVVWKREGLKARRKRYVSRARAERFMLLFGPEPWKAFGKSDADSYVCCPGTSQYECGCGGLTWREEAEERAKALPKLEYIRLDEREVGSWCAALQSGHTAPTTPEPNNQTAVVQQAGTREEG